MTSVVLYTQPRCGPCHRVKDWLTDKGVEFVEKDVTSDYDALSEMKALGFQGTPVIKTDSDAWIGVNLEKMKGLL